MRVRVASQAFEQLKAYDLKKLGKFKKSLEMLGIKGKCTAGYRYRKF